MGVLSDLFGSRISIPVYNKLDYGDEQSKAIANNTKNLSADEALTGAANDFTRSQINKNLEAAIPDYSAINAQTSKNILSESKGEIPQDVQDAIRNSGAGKSLGLGGGGMRESLVARDLGITSLDLTNKALTSAESWTKTISSIYDPSMMNVSSMFVTPQQQYTADEQQNENSWNQKYLQAQSDATADPVTSGLFKMATGAASSVASAAAGSSSGGGGL